MKKRRIVSALLALSLLVPCAFSNQSVVFAATTKEEIFSDGFDAEKIDSVLWETGSDGAGKLQKQYNAMRLDIDTEDWGPDISLLSYKIEKNCSISLSLTNGDIRKWFGIAFGKSKVTDTFTVDASHLFLIYSNMISVMTNTGDGLDDSTIAANSVNGANGAIIADTAAKSTCYVRLDLEKLDSGKYAMDVFAGDDKAELNKLVSYGRAGGLSAEGLELDGYISLSGQQFSLEINEFTITDESGTAFDAEFKPEQISYSGESSKGKVWGITNSWGRYDVYCGAFNRVLLTDGANLISKLPIAKNTQTEQRFKLSFELHAEQSDWKEASFAGVYFDIDESKRFIGVGKHPYSDNFVLVYYQNNRVLDIIELSTGTILNGKNQITMKEYYGDVMTVDINGNECILKNVNSAGKFAFGLYGLNTKTEDSTVQMDNVSFVEYTFNNATSSSYTNNFGGTKADEEDPTYLERYINRSKFYVGGDVTSPKGMATSKNQTLNFNNCTKYGYFSPRETYSDWILRFDIKIVDEYNITKNEDGTFNLPTGKQGAMFGISFGKDYIAQNTLETNGFFFYNWYNPDYISNPSAYTGEAGQIYHSTYCLATNVNTGKYDEVARLANDNLWSDSDAIYHVMAIARNSTVQIYLQRLSDAESEIPTLVATLTDVNTHGYVAIVGLDQASFRIMNYSITNISPYRGGITA